MEGLYGAWRDLVLEFNIMSISPNVSYCEASL
jgi:hypothetical protein